MLPQFGSLRRQQRLSDVHCVAHERFRLWTKREIDAALGAEHVGDDGIATALHAFEQQRGTALLNYAAMDLGELEVRIDLRFDGDDLVFPGKSIEECAQARMHSSGYGLSAGFSTVRGRTRVSPLAGSPRRFSISSW